mgnify:CR=1 FL=1
MDASLLDQVFDHILQQVVSIITTFVPAGMMLAQSFVVLSVLFVGVSIWMGMGNLLSPLVRVAAVATGTYFAIENWGDIVTGMLQACDTATRMMIPGYHGTAALFTMAIDVAGRIEMEKIAITWTAPLSSAIAVMVGAFVPLLVVIGLGFIAILAVTAKLTLLLGGTLAPLILPALAFGPTATMGWGPIQFLLTASVRVVVMGAMSHLFASAITSLLPPIPGGTDWLQNNDIYVLALLSVVCIIAGLGANTLAGSLVGNALGTLGAATVGRAGGIAFQAASLPVSAAASVGSAAARMTSGAASGAAGSAGSAAARSPARSSGSGGAFAP